MISSSESPAFFIYFFNASPFCAVIFVTSTLFIADAVMIPLEEVKDDAFAQKMMGDGVAFELKEDVVLSPCNADLL